MTFTAAAAVAGSLSWYFSNKVSEQKDGEFRTFRETSKIAVAKADAKAAEANERAAQANRIAEEERLARVKLEARLAARSLNEDSQITVANAIKQFAPQPYDLLWYPDDQESFNLANQIFGSFQRAGWARESSNSFLGFHLTEGVIIEFSPTKTDTVGAACKALAAALEQEGIKALSGPWANDEKQEKPERAQIKVGKKP